MRPPQSALMPSTAGVDRGAHQALADLPLQVVDPPVGFDQVDGDRRHGAGRT
jgi:hypothetical protein